MRESGKRLAYGAALNEGRALFAGDKEFSAWMAEWQVAIQVEAHERSAAMWAAANADQLAEARASSKARRMCAQTPQQMHPVPNKTPRRSLLVRAPGELGSKWIGSNPDWLPPQRGGIEAVQEAALQNEGAPARRGPQPGQEDRRRDEECAASPKRYATPTRTKGKPAADTPFAGGLK